ncbi:16S rRNA (cytidine(1402)-2'-O)-methyltransferase [Thalassococcus sp. CAU 1522]|uniref:Ribosomal RNA small subunit methyltransferase I n=1 Tax=Thalassococcus arenae TaxID=2851652 RepID=A0ABS6N7H3_9RHOB|nr:16S rRNA (cytidine(1402)-2'-O)-methyltransferase [Thalassococcus arenae]MBV2359961.1 16S rRNA (cytidine(1402)-2'-O)-methyltransferase [Thalassococcus arenae]
MTPGLYLAATPIGHARDITLRVLDALAGADVLAAEDTRSLRKLMEIHGIGLGDRPLVAYHDHSGARVRDRLMAEIAGGKAVLYASEAGTPLISDPGFELVRAAHAAGHAVTALPGVSAVVTALSVAGLPTDRFLFLGFLPNTGAARRRALEAVAPVEATLAVYESPKRLAAMLGDAAAVLGATRPAAVCRELTKKFEECRRGSLAELAEAYTAAPPKGEIVVLIGKGVSMGINESLLEDAVRQALMTMSVRDAADLVSQAHGVPRRKVYQMAMAVARDAADK